MRSLHHDIDDLESRDPAFIERLLPFIERTLIPWHRAEVRGVDRVPDGPALFVGNHSGGMMTVDSVIFGAAVLRAHGFGGLPWGLGHSLPLQVPGLSTLLGRIGAVRACDDNAGRLFAAGRKVLVYPGGDIEAMRPFRERNLIKFGGRIGYMRTALRYGVPVIPVVGEGSHAAFFVIDDLPWLARMIGAARFLRIKVWPATITFPWGLTLGPPPPYLPMPVKITMEILAPIHFERSGEEAAHDDAYVHDCDRLVRDQMQATLDRLAA